MHTTEHAHVRDMALGERPKSYVTIKEFLSRQEWEYFNVATPGLGVAIGGN